MADPLAQAGLSGCLDWLQFASILINDGFVGIDGDFEEICGASASSVTVFNDNDRNNESGGTGVWEQ